jgi:hypothetical protein
MQPIVTGEIIFYRQFDVGYEILLDTAFEHLISSAPERRKPVRGEASAIQIPNPPVTVHLGVESLSLGARAHDVDTSAQLFDFGVISVRAKLAVTRMPWDELCSIGASTGQAQIALLDACLDRLLQRITPAVVRFGRSPVTEEYTVFRVHQLEKPNGAPYAVGELSDEVIARLLLSESKPLSPGARADLLSQRFSYYEDDLAVLTWSAALVVEPAAADTDVQYVLEFANAQLLELRFHDAVLDSELPRTYDEIATARQRFKLLGRRFSRLLAALQARVADATEAVERVDNSLKVTDDVYLARIYAAALDIFRGPTWRRGIDRKVAIIRDAYAMLNAESQARRTEVLELIIIVLIAVEIVLALLWR